MMRRILYALSGHLPCRLIYINDAPYLERYYLGSLFGFTAYLHRFVAPDGDREVHDHPWRVAMSFVLAGHYLEEWVQHVDLQLPEGWKSKMRRIRWFNWIPGHRFHRIAEASPNTWTLFVHGQRTKGWGFLANGDVLLNGCEQQTPIVSYIQPYEVKANLNWHLTAPKGKASQRASAC